MSPPRRKKRSRFVALLFLLLFLLLAGSAAVVLWLYRGDVDAIFRRTGEDFRPRYDGKPSQEIREEERKQLEDILKQRG